MTSGAKSAEESGNRDLVVCGKVAEWFKATVLKTVVGASPPWVRIPPFLPGVYRSVNNENSEDLIWKATLDGKYAVGVMRVPDLQYEGTLYVYRLGDLVEDSPECLYTQKVYLSQRSDYGPDRLDINDWKKIVEDLVDNGQLV